MAFELVFDCVPKGHDVVLVSNGIVCEGCLQPFVHFMYVVVEGDEADSLVLEGGGDVDAGVVVVGSRQCMCCCLCCV